MRALLSVLFIALVLGVVAHSGAPAASATTDTTPPTVSSVQLDPNDSQRIIVQFTESVEIPQSIRTFVASLDLPGWMSLNSFYYIVFALWVDGYEFSPDFVSHSGDTMTFQAEEDVVQGQTVSFNYNNVYAKDAEGLFADSSGNVLAADWSMDVSTDTASTTDDWDFGDGKLELSVVEQVIEEGESMTFTVKPSIQPDGDLTVTGLATGGCNSLTPSSLTFTESNWQTAQTVTLGTCDDTDTLNTWFRVTFDKSDQDRFGEYGQHIRVVAEDPD